MLIHATKPLFPWDELETSPTLATIRQALQAIPDGPLLDALRKRRHNGCDTYAVSVLWGVLLLSILLRHTTTEACLEELCRNAPLRLLVGIDSEDAVPHGWNLTRFLAVLGQTPYLALLRGVFDHMVQRLGVAVPDLGRHTAGDSTGLCGRREPNATRAKAEVDARHEVVLAYHITDTKAGDNECVEPLVEPAQANLPEGRIQTLAYDKAADDAKAHQAFTTLLAKAQRQDRSFGIMTLSPIARKRQQLVGEGASVSSRCA